jgi:hypothetical protein
MQIKHIPIMILGAILLMGATECDDKSTSGNKTAFEEQARTELNQAELFAKQPPPRLTWSLERDNLTKRFKLQNDRSVNFYMYIFIEGFGEPVGYYQINKVSSVDSQLTNTQQVVNPSDVPGGYVIPSPAEDGSYGTNGSGVFGFTPEDIYIEHNMKYIVSTIPLTFAKPIPLLAIVNSDAAQAALEASKKAMKE